MNKLQPSIIALSCIMALSACSSSSKGGTDNSEQIRQTEIELNQKIAEANKKAEDAVKKAEEAAKANSQKQTESDKKAEEATQTEKPQSQQTDTEKSTAQETLKKAEEAAKAAQANNQKTEAEKNAAQEALKKAEEAAKAAQASSQKTEAEKKAAEERLKKLENLKADEKARIPLSDKIFGGISGNMEDAISGGVLIGEGNNINRPQARDIQHLAVTDKESGKVRDFPIFREAASGEDEWGIERYDPYNLHKEGQNILSNSNFQASAFGTYSDSLIDQYFFAQGNPTALAQIPTSGKVEYNGGAVYKKDGEKFFSEMSKMTATADFANKVIDINIKKNLDAVPEMKFGGKITGNSFAGEVDGIKTQGGFFGKDAQEMTGLFTNEADKSRGAFGGIKK